MDTKNKVLSISLPPDWITFLKKEALRQTLKKGKNISVSSLILKSLKQTWEETEK